MIQSLWKTVWQFLMKLNTLTIHPVVILPGIYPKELKTYVHIKTFTQIFTAVLFTIAKTWKPSRFPSIDDWINCGIIRQ